MSCRILKSEVLQPSRTITFGFRESNQSADYECENCVRYGASTVITRRGCALVKYKCCETLFDSQDDATSKLRRYYGCASENVESLTETTTEWGQMLTNGAQLLYVDTGTSTIASGTAKDFVSMRSDCAQSTCQDAEVKVFEQGVRTIKIEHGKRTNTKSVPEIRLFIRLALRASPSRMRAK